MLHGVQVQSESYRGPELFACTAGSPAVKVIYIVLRLNDYVGAYSPAVPKKMSRSSGYSPVQRHVSGRMFSLIICWHSPEIS